MHKLGFSISTKLIGAFLAVAVIQLAFCLYAISQLDVIGTYFSTAYTEAVQPLNQWADFDLAMRGIETSLNRHVAEERPAVQQEIEEHIVQDLNTAAELLATVEGGTLSAAKRQQLVAEDEAGVDHSDADFTKHSNDTLVALVRYQFEFLQSLCEEVIDNSKNFIKEDAALAINTGEGLESFVLIEKAAETLRTRLDKKVASYRDQSLTLRSHVQAELIAGSLLTILFAVGIGIVISRGITRPLKGLVDVFKRLAIGQRVEKVEIARRDELGRLLESMNLIIDSNQSIIDQANTIAEGDYSAEMTPRSDQDELGVALNKMTDNLRTVSAQNETDRWLKTGQSELSDIMRGELNLPTLSKNVVAYLAKHVGAQVGVMYVSDEDKTLHLTGSYAFTQRKHLTEEIAPGQGLVGQAALEEESILISEVPEDYITVNSGLGEASPRSLMAVPVVFEGIVKGVVELGTLTRFNDTQSDYLKLVSENIAIAINSAQDRQKVNTLLKATQDQATELQAQQEELRATNEELEEHTQALKNSEVKLQAQSEELRASNEELEEKSEYLTEQKEAIEQKNRDLEITRRDIERQAQELELASKYKSEFLANMSHELRTPLNSLLILAKSLSGNDEGNLSSEQVESAQVIYDGGRDLLRLINDILDLSKVEAGKLDIHFEDLSLDTLASRLRVQFDPVAKEKGLEFRIEHEPDAPATLQTDGQRTEQVLKNLLSNAMKFTSEGSVTLKFHSPAEDVRLRTAGMSADKAVAISVVDTGIGIPEDRQGAVFEAFRQGDGSTSRKFGGTGLGLAISRELAKLLGGEIHIQSQPDQGSTFTLYLPTEQAVIPPTHESVNTPFVSTAASRPTNVINTSPQVSAAALPRPISDDRDQLADGEKTLLIVEDDVQFAKILVKLARERGYKCLAAVDGSSGLQMAAEYVPTAILLDLGLPDIDGLGVLDQLKDNLATRHIPVHIISARDEVVQSLSKGAIGHMVKPAAVDDIQQAFSTIESQLTDRVKKVLIVEDDEVVRRHLAAAIETAGIEITSVQTGRQACQEIADGVFDCMILDLGLPDMTGFDLLQRLRDQQPDDLPPVVVYTGRSLTRPEHKALSRHAGAIVLKGVDSEDRVLDEVSLFLHSVESTFAPEQQRVIRMLHDPDQIFKDRKVLLVDDDMRNTFALSQALQKSGLNVVMADNGKLGLEKLHAEPDIELVVMDIMMPVMDGYEAMRAIRAESRYEKLPIIALTAKAMPEDRAKCLEAGANDYLTKPVDVDTLMSLMRVWLFRNEPVTT